MNHSPTPWLARSASSMGGMPLGKINVYSEDEAYSQPIVLCGLNQLPQPEKEANAAFVVLSVNSHDTLVAAVQSLKAALEAWTEIADKDDQRYDDDQAIAKADAALHLAGEGEDFADWAEGRLVEKIAHAAKASDLDESCLLLQKYLGQNDGGFAGVFYSGNCTYGDDATPKSWDGCWPYMTVAERTESLTEYAKQEIAGR